MIIKYCLIFYILFYFPAIGFPQELARKPDKIDYFLKSNEEIVYLKDKNGTIFELKPFRSMESQMKGLSGIKRKQLKTNQGAIFIYKEVGLRSFWMPDTYFDLAIIFLDENLSVKHVEKKASAHPGRKEPPMIYRTKSFPAKYVIEIPAENPLIFSLSPGDKFQLLK